ncbi:MAG: RING finger protein [Armatimonadota bacterium]
MSNLYAGVVCPYCNMPVEDSVEFMVCLACDTPHHMYCWEQKDGCSKPGCHSTTGSEQNSEVAVDQLHSLMKSAKDPQKTFLPSRPLARTPHATATAPITHTYHNGWSFHWSLFVLMAISFGLGLLLGATVFHRHNAPDQQVVTPDLTRGITPDAGVEEDTSTGSATTTTIPALAPDKAKAVIAGRATQTLQAIKNKDYASLSTLIHPEKGIRFSPVATVNPQTDVSFTADQVGHISVDRGLYNWGQKPGSSEPLRMSIDEYWSQHVYDLDFMTAKQISYNQPISVGATPDNSAQVYPGAIVVEYYFPGFNPKFQGKDWEGLRLIFEQKGDTWYLTGITHDSGM